MSKFWSPFVSTLVPYVPGEQPKLTKLIKLNTNENPYGPSPKALAAMRAGLTDDLRLYPDPNSDLLTQAVATYYGVQPNQVFLGNGSDEVLAHVFNALLRHDKPLLFPDISYSFYPVYCGLYGIEFDAIALDEQFQICVEDYARPNGGIIFPNPNAPTGCLLALDAVAQMVTANPDSVVVVDEAYIDFGGETAISLVDRFPNLLVTQTVSKSRSLAGLRVGLAVGHPDLIEALERVKNSFNSYPLDRLAILGATAAFEDRQYFERTCKAVIDSREVLIKQLEAKGFEVLPSAANFIFARHPQHDAAGLAARLREQGVIVRHFKQERIAQFLRISIGTPEHNQALVDGLGDL
ncbi:histidinol-phosphate transaminase [Pseudomonas sp. CCI3.2]|uniref:histidinol-phosphate transaminase n=1 Tax=unclassified Pseudomonas TaxID=196821 RepID=UPI002AC8C60B|nr:MULTISPECIES: histidinol-phosphate transaminase [unclassified Pseudomonas]MEB0079420.1 histidinol-phosphate transaminase [Pseudomonas sp. MH10out]MEB0102654.1 histidinol-phosphate transaminase [Pseudomonas sp. CCI3.2]MEB0133246.1 histidinol-phosphate transaminase [Pseudomonas sp. CCI2.4]MEB0159669.1 histidinol-phosphate transaminase [Pseudomonas sp. AH2 (2023)]MEB0168612.1 histidinol-phosphate transaminase [Pseudomonas sp. CCC4.4]